jgi:hypothetical protein
MRIRLGTEQETMKLEPARFELYMLEETIVTLTKGSPKYGFNAHSTLNAIKKQDSDL